SPRTERQRKPRVNGNGDGGDQTISLDDFYAYMPTHRYIFAPCRQLWPARSVNARLGSIEGIAANVWLDQNRHVEQMTWAPGEPVEYAIAPWNFTEVSPTHMFGRFNGFVRSVILRVSEARDLGDVNRFAFYEHMKIYSAAPPDVFRCDEKNLREYSVPNVCGV